MEECFDADRLRSQRAALARFGRHALRTDDLDELLQEAVELIADATGVRLVKVLELVRDQGVMDQGVMDRGVMLVRAGVNWPPGVVGHATFGADVGSPSGYAMRTGEAVISEDLASETRFRIPALLKENEVKSMVNVVIDCERGAWGVLEVDSPRHRSFSQDDVVFLETYANLLAAAIDRLDSHRRIAEAKEWNDLLFRELQHRIGNLLANVGSMARRTAATSASLSEFTERFDSRLAALGRTQGLLSAHPGQPVSLRGILDLELEAHGASRRGVSLDGPQVVLPPDLAQLIALAVHELSTNAVKHGALGSDSGSLAVSWSQPEDGPLEIVWRERGVAVGQRPERRGFGLDLIENALPYMTSGSCKLDFEGDGLTCVISVPQPD